MWLYVLTLRCIMLKDNPSGCLLVTVKPTVQLLLSCHQFLFLSFLPVSPCRYCILSFSAPQLDPFLSLIHPLPFCPCPRMHRGHRTMAAIQPLHASCADWHRRDGSAHVVPCCCRVHLEGRDKRQLKRSTKWLRRPQPYLFVSVTFSNTFKLMYSRQHGGWTH